MDRSTPYIVLAVIVVGMLAVTLLTRCSFTDPRQIDPPAGPTASTRKDQVVEATAAGTRVLRVIDAGMIAAEPVAGLAPVDQRQEGPARRQTARHRRPPR